MSTTMIRQTASPAPRRSRLDRRTAMHLAAVEYDRFAATLAGLHVDDWARPTLCTRWDVRKLACHTVGMAEMAAGIREGNRQRAIAATDAEAMNIEFIDALTDLQVRERSDWDPARIVRGMRDVGPRAARGRRRTPFFIRRRTMPVPQLVNGRREDWSIGFLVDTVLTRDPWMHRMDIANAVDAEPALTADHDGVIVGDAVHEWADRHEQPFTLTLTGPAGGSWSRGEGGPRIEMDAIEFCRVISGRGAAEGLLATQVPF